MNVIKYRSGYRYQLAEPSITPVPELEGAEDFNAHYFSLVGGVLVVFPGYAWDGPSFPAIRTKSFMRGSLAHDALYQAIRLGYLPAEYREAADKVLRRLCIEDGMFQIRAEWVYTAVRIGAGPAAMPSGEPVIEVAP